MPKVSPIEKWPQEVETAIKVYSNRTGLEILMFLKDNGPCTFGPIYDNVTDRVRMSVTRSLRQLEDLGVVVVDIPKGQRQHTKPKYDISRETLVSMGHTLVNLFSENADEDPNADRKAGKSKGSA